MCIPPAQQKAVLFENLLHPFMNISSSYQSKNVYYILQFLKITMFEWLSHCIISLACYWTFYKNWTFFCSTDFLILIHATRYSCGLLFVLHNSLIYEDITINTTYFSCFPSDNSILFHIPKYGRISEIFYIIFKVLKNLIVYKNNFS